MCLLTLTPVPTPPQKEQHAGSTIDAYSWTPGRSNLCGMQRLFSMFPRGGPGIGLLLLRLSVVAATLHACSPYATQATWIFAALVLLCALLCAGTLTPLAAVVAAGVQLAVSGNVTMTGAGIGSAILGALALTVLGPGAYSLDAYRYGRRLLVLPSRSDRDLD